MQTGYDNEQLMSDINVTPFVDVMLVLLIIFMVTAPMMVQGVNVNLPVASANPLGKESEHLVISIKQNHMVYINDQAVGIDFLTQKLEKIMENGDKRDVYLRADKNVAYGIVVDVMSKVKKAGVETIGMVTLPGDNKSW